MWSGDFDDFSGESRKKRRKIEKTVYHLKVCEPTDIKDLVTHSKKISEVQGWLEWAKKKSAILLLTGPAGSAKTTTLKVVAKSLGIEIQEWINPVDKIEFADKDWMEPQSFYDSSIYSEPNQLEKFENFAFRSSRYQGLFTTAVKRIILVEDFPNHFVWRPSIFTEFLNKYRSYGNCPIVFICTDDEKINLQNTLFPNNVREYLQISQITFNPISHTALMKVLTKHAGSISKSILNDLAKASCGDIRTALSNLEFYVSGSKEANKSTKIVKDVTTEFYQTLGRVLYPKRTDTGSRFLYDVREIAQSYNSTFCNMLHENYLNTFTSLKDVIEGCTVFSDCDLFSNYDDLNAYAALTVVIGLMKSNKVPKRGGFQPMSRSRWTGVLKESGENARPYPQLQMTRRTMNLDVIPYLKHFPHFAGHLAESDADRLRCALTSGPVFKTVMPKPANVVDEVDEEIIIEEFEDDW